LDDVPS